MKTFVLAGSYQEYLTFCHKRQINPKQNKEYVYLSGGDDILKTCGLENWKIKRIGTWNKNYSRAFIKELYTRQGASTR